MNVSNIITLLCITIYSQSLFTQPSETEITQECVTALWENRAHEWAAYLGDRGENDHNRVYQSDPVLWKMLKDVKNLTVLDVGCGQGYLSRELSRKGAHVISIDISPTLIDLAKKKSLEESVDVDYRVEDSSCMKTIPSQSIDRVVCNYVLMDIPELENTIKEFHRVLKPDGEVVTIFLHPCFPMETIQKTSHLFLYGWKSPYFREHVMQLPQWEGFSDRFTTFHRPLSTYWKIFKKAGFEILEFDEPYLSEEAKKLLDPDLVENFTFMPHSVAFLLRKKT